MNDEFQHTDKNSRAGIVAVVGRTNVGKSTLVNHLLGEKVSIVSDTVQTTRNLIRAILTEERGQLVFLDTPGVHKAQGELGKNLNKAARSAVQGVD
ncbi:MAG: 50S ribosome-binding GTPase, partial [Pontiella sp.]|nr:50S ribosome-binding GTPase [Pontiella sp.]